MINRSVVRIRLLPTVFKEYFDMFFKVVRKNISQKINRNINSCCMRVPVPSCSRSMISGQNLTGADGIRKSDRKRGHIVSYVAHQYLRVGFHLSVEVNLSLYNCGTSLYVPQCSLMFLQILCCFYFL